MKFNVIEKKHQFKNKFVKDNYNLERKKKLFEKKIKNIPNFIKRRKAMNFLVKNLENKNNIKFFTKRHTSLNLLPYNKLTSFLQINTKAFEDLFFKSILLKDYKIIGYLMGNNIKSVKVKISTVSRTSRAGRQLRKKVCVAVGDGEGHLGLAIKSSKNPALAFWSASRKAKLNITRVRRGHYNQKIGPPHTIKLRMSGKAGSLVLTLFPAPGGTSVVALKQVFPVSFACGVTDVHSCKRGSTKSGFNTARAAFNAYKRSSTIPTPDIWCIYNTI